MEVVAAAEEENMECTLDGSVDIRGKPALRRKTGGFRRAGFILVNQGLVCVALYGVSANLVVFLTDVLGEGDSSAAANTSNWQGAQYFFAVIGGFVGDAYLGRYKSAVIFQMLGICGLVLVGLSASIPSFHELGCGDGNPDCTASSLSRSKLGSRVFYVAIYMIALGYGCYQPNAVSFGADQFDDERETERVRKLRFFNWFYVSLTVGTLFSSTALVYIENRGEWALSFWISACAGGVALLAFLIPTSAYRFHFTGGNPLCRIAQVVMASIRKRHVKHSPESSYLYEIATVESAIRGSRKIAHTNALRCLDRAATITAEDMGSSCGGAAEEEEEKRSMQGIAAAPWRLCTVTQVEEVKWVVRMLPIWACTIMFTVAYTQVYSLFVIQGEAMEARVGGVEVPAAGLYAIDCITVVLSIVAYDKWLMPWARRWKWSPDGLTGLQRIGAGMPIVALAMLEAGFVEMARLSSKRADDGGRSISILWQVPQYITTGVSETFTYIGQMHFFYDQAPDAMRSIGSALPQASVALGSYGNSLLLLAVAKFSASPGWIPDSGSLDEGHLHYFFFLVAGLTLANFGLFCLLASRYRHTDHHAISPSPQAMPLFPSAADLEDSPR